MVEKFELAWVLGFGLFIGGFFGFVLSFGDWMFAGASAVALAVVALIYAVKLGERRVHEAV